MDKSTVNNVTVKDDDTPRLWADFTDILASACTPLSIETFGDTARDIVRRITDFIGPDHAYIILSSPKEGLDYLACAGVDSPDGVGPNGRISPDGGPVTASTALTGMVRQTGMGRLVPDAMNSEEFAGDPQFQRFNTNTAICVPVTANRNVLGVIYADSNSPTDWDEQTVRLLIMVGRVLGSSIHHAILETQRKENMRLAMAGGAMLKLSHSVKNILQMISGAAEVVDFGLQTNQISRVKRSWDILKPNLDRMQRFTLEMLDYSKERRLEPGPCEPNRVIQGAIDSLQSHLKVKHGKLAIRVDRKMPTVELDSERLHEMVLNLILNALDVVDARKGLVTVRTRWLCDDGIVQVSVADNGPGITDEMKEKIFTPFESDKSRFGTGLGMAIVKRIAEQHNGWIDIETTAGKGTTFTVSLPTRVLR